MNDTSTDRVPVSVAAERIHLTAQALYKRIYRGDLVAVRREDGRGPLKVSMSDVMALYRPTG